MNQDEYPVLIAWRIWISWRRLDDGPPIVIGEFRTYEWAPANCAAEGW